MFSLECKTVKRFIYVFEICKLLYIYNNECDWHTIICVYSDGVEMVSRFVMTPSFLSTSQFVQHLQAFLLILRS